MTGVTLTEALPGLGPISTSGYRPWWETIRLYMLNTLLANSVIVFYISYNSQPPDCIPRRPATEFINSTNRIPDFEEMPSLSASVTKFVNSVCFLQMDGNYRFVGRFVLIGCLALYGAYSWWELLPKVKNQFFTVKDVDKLLAEGHMPKSDIKKSVIYRGNKLVEDVLQRLFFLKSQRISLFWLYIARNLIALVFVGIGIILAWKFHVRCTEEIGGTFNCSLDSDAVAEVGAAEFLCSNSLPSRLDLYSLAMFSLLIVLEVITAIILIVSIIVMCRRKVSKNLSPDGRILCMDYAFVLFFSRSSLGVHDSTKEMLSLFEDDFVLDKLIEKDFVNKGIDEERLLLFLNLRKDGAEKLANRIDIFIEGRPTLDFCGIKNNEYFKLAQLGLAGFHGLFKILFSKKEYKSFLQLHEILFVEFNVHGISQLTVLDLDRARCCCGITLTKEHLVDNNFYKVLRTRYRSSYGQRVIMHILLKLLPEEERSEFLNENKRIFDFITCLKSRKVIDETFFSQELDDEAKIYEIVPHHLKSLMNARLGAEGGSNTTDSAYTAINIEANSFQGLRCEEPLYIEGHVFSINRVPGDGSCFFDAVINQLFLHLHPSTVAKVVGEQTDNITKPEIDSYPGFLEKKIQECIDKIGRHCAVFEATAKAIGHRILIVHLNEINQQTLYPFGTSGKIFCLALKKERFRILRPTPPFRGDYLLGDVTICLIEECFKVSTVRKSIPLEATPSSRACYQLLTEHPTPPSEEDGLASKASHSSSSDHNGGTGNRIPASLASRPNADLNTTKSSSEGIPPLQSKTEEAKAITLSSDSAKFMRKPAREQQDISPNLSLDGQQIKSSKKAKKSTPKRESEERSLIPSDSQEQSSEGEGWCDDQHPSTSHM